MRVTLALAQFYSNLDLKNHSTDEIVEKVGAQLGAVEEVIDLAPRYEGVLVAKVFSCTDHPDADRLHVCKIDDGGKATDVERDENGHVQVVCGAPNVREGLTVAWLPPGSTVPDTYGKDPFVLEARPLRGVVSNGMLASPRELGIGDNHEGIMELDDGIVPGTSFIEAYHLDDHILDIENKMFTHRPDCFGVIGVYRELAGILGQKFEGPEWYNPGGKYDLNIEAETLPLEVRNELPELVPRFTAIAMDNISVKPSPAWLQVHLMRAGIRPINNIVDATNYIMYLTGQPLHAYDYDKVVAQDQGSDKATIVVRHPKAGEKILLLNGKEIEPREEAIMIATNDKLIGVGGVMGGGDTEVDNDTKRIIIEVASFDMYSIRRTSMAHGLFTDAVSRFNKGQSPLQNERIIAKMVHEARTLAGGKVASEFIDINHVSPEAQERQSLYPPVEVTTNFVNDRLGFQLSADEMARLLTNVEFDIAVDDDKLTVKAPFWRTDIEIPEDVVEEVGRLYGFDHLPLQLPKRDLTPTPKDELLELKARIRQVLARAGANEILTYNFVHGNLLERAGQDKSAAFQISNALSPDLQYYRMSLTPSLLEKVHPNIKAGYDEFFLFELNKTHNKLHNDEELPNEYDMLALVVAMSDKKAAAKPGAAYYEARKYLDFLASSFGVELDYLPMSEELKYPVGAPYDYKRSALVCLKGTDEVVGLIGEFRASVTKNLKLPKYCAGFEIGPEVLVKPDTPKHNYKPLPRFPRVAQDICLRVAADMPYQEREKFVTDHLDSNRPDQTHHSLEALDIYQPEGQSDYKQITFRLSIASYERTLTDEEVNSLLDKIAAAAKEKLGAERI